MAKSGKEKQRLKRKKKQQALRKQRNASQYGLAARGELVECWINSDWAERGQAVAFVLRRMSGGRMAVATFMVDLWCAGLKDAWGQLDVTREDVQEMIDTQNQVMDGTITRTTLETVAAVVAGAVRFAVQSGFRLPEKYERWTAFCGEAAANWRNADLSKFGVDDGKGGKKLRWVAPLFDLRRRLVGMSVEQFMSRPDVEVITEADDEYYDGGAGRGLRRRLRRRIRRGGRRGGRRG